MRVGTYTRCPQGHTHASSCTGHTSAHRHQDDTGTGRTQRHTAREMRRTHHTYTPRTGRPARWGYHGNQERTCQIKSMMSDEHSLTLNDRYDGMSHLSQCFPVYPSGQAVQRYSPKASVWHPGLKLSTERVRGSSAGTLHQSSHVCVTLLVLGVEERTCAGFTVVRWASHHTIKARSASLTLLSYGIILTTLHPTQNHSLSTKHTKTRALRISQGKGRWREMWSVMRSRGLLGRVALKLSLTSCVPQLHKLPPSHARLPFSICQNP